jgi:heme exporter protein B
VFSFLAAIAAKAQQPSAIMAILGFPLIIPQLMLLMKIANIAFSDIVQNGLPELAAMLVGFDVMIIALAYILFPHLWKE